MGADLILRYIIITFTAHIACAWIQTFQTPWPLVDAFELADTAEEQLFRSLGVRFDGLVVISTIVNVIGATRMVLADGLRIRTIGLIKSEARDSLKP